MKRNASAILLVLGIFLMIVALNFFLLVDSQTENETEQWASRSSYRSTPYGMRAFYTLLEESGYRVTRLETPFTKLNERPDIGTLVIIAPPPTNNPDEKEFKSLIKWVEEGGVLVIIDREINIDFGDARAETYTVANPRAGALPLQPTRYTRGLESVALSNYATRVKVDSRTAIYHLGDDQGAVLAGAEVGTGRVLLLTDPYVVANNGIAQADNVILALNLLADRTHAAVGFDEFHHGYGSSAPEGMMSYFRGTPVPWMLAQAGIITALVVYTYGRRFARPLPLVRERRTTNLEFVSSMANITRLARASDLAMQNIYSEFHKRLCRYSGLPPGADRTRLAADVARRARIDERELRELLARSEEIARGAAATDGEMLQIVARIREVEHDLGL